MVLLEFIIAKFSLSLYYEVPVNANWKSNRDLQGNPKFSIPLQRLHFLPMIAMRNCQSVIVDIVVI